MRQLKDTNKRNYASEEELATLWTSLSFALNDLGIHKLAKRCLIKGKQWADPEHMDQDFLEKADISLERIELIANQVLIEINQ